MMESDLSEPVTNWLKSQGFEVYVEVPLPYGASHIDVVGRKDCDLICVELKTSLSKGVIHQAFRCQLLTSKVYAAVARKPRLGSLTPAAERGIGVLLVKEIVKVVTEPAFTNMEHLYAPAIDRLHNYLDHMEPGGIAGKPNLKGVGPAKECGRRVTVYLTANPNAKWKDVYANVSNHYASANSMRSAMDRWCYIRN
jgi:hypothetical protein